MSDHLSGHLSYFDIEGEHLMHDDGSVSRIFSFEGLDPSGMTEEALLSVNMDIQSIYNLLEEGMDLQTFFRSKNRYEKGLRLYDAIAQSQENTTPFGIALCGSLIEALKFSNLFGSDVFLILTLATHQSKDRFKNFEKNKGASDFISQTIFSHLQNSFSKVKKLGKQDIIDLLYETLNPDRWQMTQSFNQKGVLPKGMEDRLSNRLTFQGICFQKDYFYTGQTYGQTVTLFSKPSMSHPAMFYRLLMQLKKSFHFYCSFKVQGMDQYKEIQAKNRYRGILESFSTFSLFAKRRNYKMEAKFEDNEGYIEALEKKGEKTFKFHFSITHFANNVFKLRDQSKDIIKAFRSLNGADAFVQEYEQQRGYLSSLPASRTLSKRPYQEITQNITNLAPLYEPYKGKGSPTIMFRNQLNGLISFDLFAAYLENFNSIISGTSGSGKSFFTSHITRPYMAQNHRVMFIDIGGSYKRSIEMFKGKYLSLDSQMVINPLFPKFMVMDKGVCTSWALQHMIEILQCFINDQDSKGLSLEEKLLLSSALEKLYASFDSPILDNLIEVLNLEFTNKKQARIVEKIIDKLSYWTKGPYQHMFNNKQILNLNHQIMGFDLQGVPEEVRPHIFMILSAWIDIFVFRQKGKKLIIFDEAWELIESASSLIEGLYRKARKSNAAIISIAQSYSDFLKCPISEAIVANSSSKFILKVGENMAPIEKSLSLNKADVDSILSLKKVSGHFSESFVKQGQDKFIARVVPTPLEYWLSTTDPKDLEIQEDFQDKFSHFDSLRVLIELANQYPFGFNAREAHEKSA